MVHLSSKNSSETQTVAAPASVGQGGDAVTVGGDSRPVSSSTHARLAIPILADTAASGGCGHCHGRDDEPACAVPAGGAPARLSGERQELDRVEQALSLCPELGGFGLDSGVIRTLHAEGGEVAITLNVGACGGGARLVHAVFDNLRQLLPDTDIYVTPAS
ncbi:MAG: hypothetical protein RIQ60_3292 [Pseudomonadota bacterium]|jgi:hypothetical protein